jgi:hypothetical protein
VVKQKKWTETRLEEKNKEEEKKHISDRCRTKVCNKQECAKRVWCGCVEAVRKHLVLTPPLPPNFNVE